MPAATAADFLDVIEKSGLVTARQLDEVFGRELPGEPAEIANALVQAGILTLYQAKQLMAGKHRGFFLGPYKILRPIGKGGMGTVFLGEHTSLDRKVALKILSAEHAKDRLNLDRFQREARAAAALDHQNIVRLHDISQGAGVHFLVMEFVDGNDLQALMGQTGPLHYAQAAQYIAQAAGGLQHAHDKGFVHRDMKPANLMLGKDGVVKILDMGLARTFHNDKDNLTAVQAEGEIAGTVDFLSPEQAMNHPLDERSDIYSLGATFYTLLTGHPPFSGTTAQKLAQHQMKDPPPVTKKLNGRVPPALSAVITKMMAKNKSERYQTANDVIDALGPWLPAPTTGNVVHDPVTRTDLGGLTRSISRAIQPAASKLSRKTQLAVGGGVLAVLALVAGIGLWGGSGSAAKPPVGPIAGLPPADQVEPPVPARFRMLPLADVATASAGGPFFTRLPHDRFAFDRWGTRTVFGVPFTIPDPNSPAKNIVILYGPRSIDADSIPRSVRVPVGTAARTLHVLGGVSGWGWAPRQPAEFPSAGTPSVVVRLHYTDGTTEEHLWRNGEQLADFFNPTAPVDVPGSRFALAARNAQVRYLTVTPDQPSKPIAAVEFAKAEEDGETSPVVIAVTAEQSTDAPPAAAPPPAAAAAPPPAPASFAARGKFQPIDFGAAANSSAGGPLFARFPADKLPFDPAGEQTVSGVPFVVPAASDRENNMLTFYGPMSEPTRRLPRSARVPVGGPVRALHFLSGVSAWGWPFEGEGDMRSEKGTTTLTVRLEYADKAVEEHEWKNGEHFADFIKRIDVPGSEFAFLAKNGKQVRYLSLYPRRSDAVLTAVEFVKGEDDKTSPAIVALTVERPDGTPPPAPAPAPADTSSKAGRGKFIPLDLSKLATAVRTDLPPGGKWGTVTVAGVPFDWANPLDGKRPNAVPLTGGVRVSCFLSARTVHLVGHQLGAAVKGRLHYASGATEPVEFTGDGATRRTMTVGRTEAIAHIELEPAAGDGPVVLGVTIETL